jgi:hypothetical protein
MIPIPVPVDAEHFMYIDVHYSLLCIDQAKQYYFTLTDDQLSSCKKAGQGHYVCTQQRTLLATSTAESCAVTLLHKAVTFPLECETRLVRLSNTVWTQLNNNSWIFYATQQEVMTIVCPYNTPTDVHLHGIGKIHLRSGCRGYSPNTFLYGTSVMGNISMTIPGDFVSQIDVKDML